MFGLEPANPAERLLFPIPDGRRGAVFDESLSLLRTLLEQPSVDFAGRFHTVRGASIVPRPDPPLDIWLGGSGPAALRRVDRLADGWLGSFLTPEQSGRARETIQAAAGEAGREIEPDHYGISLTVATGGIPPELAPSPGPASRALIPPSWSRRTGRRCTASSMDTSRPA